MPLDNEISPLPGQVKKTFYKAMRYLLRRLAAIAGTIVVGVFITVVVANSSGMLDNITRRRIENEANWINLSQNVEGGVASIRAQLTAESDLALPPIPRLLSYTLRSLSLDWGAISNHRLFYTYIKTATGTIATDDSRTIIFAKLPNTLILSGVAYLLLFLLGIPIALFLSQHEGHWLDRITGILTPLSSVPSWVIGILLVLIFAAELKLLPAGSMIDSIPPQPGWETITVVSKHLILPVTAIVISLIFQLVNNWRTYLLIYSNEDYVELARAKGLKKRAIELRYVLQPVLPYMLTSFVLTLVGFWQTITALEFFFNWPGIGKLFVDALPNFRGESMYAGEMVIILGIVVLFAYLLGIAAFILDFTYVLVDPRLELDSPDRLTLASLVRNRKKLAFSLREFFRRPVRSAPAKVLTIESFSLLPAREKDSVKARLSHFLHSISTSMRRALHEVSKEPAAVVGLAMVGLLVLGSIAILIFIPYNPTARDWASSNFQTNPTRAKLAMPTLVNWFRKSPLPSTIVLDPETSTATKRVLSTIDGITQIQFDFPFDYPYQEFPSDLSLYLTPKYSQKIPFVAITWITPDGREIPLKNSTVIAAMTYAFDENVPSAHLLNAHTSWKNWFVSSGIYRSPGFMLLFADPAAAESKALSGKYTLRVNAYLFEPDNDLNAQFVVFGKVEGWAGTDYLRRDLGVPLLWGLPIAMLFGVAGAIATAILSMILAASSAWYGGWIDGLVQRATEANLILPVMAIGVLLYAYYNLNLWLILALIVFLNILGSPTKAFRAAFLQEKQAAYIEAAKVYGASDWRIITRYLVPRIFPVVIPQIVILIPNFFFLEATLAIFNISDPRYPTWGRIIYDALRYGALYGSKFWVLEPIALMLVTGLAFVLVGFALNRILNPQLAKK